MKLEEKLLFEEVLAQLKIMWELFRSWETINLEILAEIFGQEDLKAIASLVSKRGANINNNKTSETTEYQGKTIFAPCQFCSFEIEQISNQLPKKKGGRKRGSKNEKEPSGWIDEVTNKDGSKRFYYCRYLVETTIQKDRIPESKLHLVREMVKNDYPAAQIEKVVLN